MRYRQCKLRQDPRETTGWIEERGAKVGALCEIQELGGLWRVVEVSDFSVGHDALKDKQNRDRGCFPSLVNA